MAAISSVFGQIVVPSQLEQDTTACLKKWFPTYIREIESQLGLPVGVIPPPTNYTTRNSFDALPGELIPKCVVISPGLADVPVKDGEGWYRANWQLGVGVATSQPTEELATQHADVYGSAVRAIINQKIIEESELIYDVEWIGETYEDLPIQDQVQLYRSAALYFAVAVSDVINRWYGPDTPDAEPYKYGEVQKVIIDTTKETNR